MPPIDVEKIAAHNPKVDLDEFRKGEEALRDLDKLGAVRRSTYGLGTPESKKIIRPVEEADHSNCVTSFRKLR